MIKNALLNQKCKSIAKAPRRREHISYSNASTIGILYNASEYEREVISQLAESIKSEGKKTVMMAFTENENSDDISFNKKDISTSGSLTKEYVSKFISQNFDFLISLDRSGDINYKYILALSNATCKIGISTKEYSDLLLMSIKPSGNAAQGLKDIMKYLKMI